MAKVDVTKLIERLDAFEDRLGVSLEGVSAFIDDEEDEDDGMVSLRVRGDLASKSGGLEADIELIAAAYDDEGRVVETGRAYFDSDSFLGLEVFEIGLYVATTRLSKIRLYPKKG